MRNWRQSFLAWDGILPLAISLMPLAIAFVFPRNDVAEITSAILVPMAAALIRTMIGAREIKMRFDGQLPVGRQLALAVAIVLLMLYEGMVSILTFANDEPLTDWVYQVVFYLCYLFAIPFVFGPRLTRRCN